MTTQRHDPERPEKEIERRTGRSFERVREQLTEMFGRSWEDVEVAVATSALKKGRNEVDVIVDLVAKADAREHPPVAQKARRAVIRWIGKPWRERANPWDKYKDNLPGPPPPTDLGEPAEEWRPFRPDD